MNEFIQKLDYHERESGEECYASTEYEEMSVDRAPYLANAVENSKLIYPGLIRMTPVMPGQKAVMANKKLKFDNSAAEALDALAIKIVNALLPTRQPPFKLEASPKALRLKKVALKKEVTKKLKEDPQFAQLDLAKQQDIITAATETGFLEFKDLIRTATAEAEKSVYATIMGSQVRAKVLEGIKQLLIAGNVCLKLSGPTTLRVFKLNQYVVEFDGEGRLQEAIIEECVYTKSLDSETIQACQLQRGEEYKLYTVVNRHEGKDSNKFTVYQEINNIMVPGSDGIYAKEALPFIFLRAYPEDGQSYSTAFVDSKVPAALTAERLTKAVVEAAALATRIVYFTSGSVSKRQFTNAENGSVLDGKADDVTVLQPKVAQDINFARQYLETVKQGIKNSFLVFQARDSDRTTLGEISRQAQELDQQLGGMYSILAEEWSQPFLSSVIEAQKKDGSFPPLPPELAQLVVVTGVDALGRNSEAADLEEYVATIAKLNPQIAQDYVNWPELLARLAQSRGIEKEGLIISQAEVQARQQAAQQAQLQQQVVPQIVKGQMDQQAQAQGQQQPPAA